MTFFNEKKFPKRSFQGSKNFLQLGKFISSSWDQTVVSSLNGYPTEVDVADGNQSRTLIFEYYNFSGIENGIGDGDVRVIDIRYFNLLGQQIEKPIRGFYIESIFYEK